MASPRTSSQSAISNREVAIRFGIIMLIVTLVDGGYVLFAAKPLLGAVLIPATIPVWVSIFVVIPMLRKPRRS